MHFFKQFSVQEGLPQSQVKVVLQDNDGLLWIATAGGGIARFDGRNFEVFGEESGLAGNIVTDIILDNQNRLFFSSTWGGISMLQSGKVIPLKGTNRQVMLFDMMMDNAQKLWVGSGMGLFEYKKDSLYRVATFIEELEHVRNVVDFGDKLLVSANTKVFEINKFTKVFRCIFENDEYIEKLFLDSNHSLWVGGSNLKILENLDSNKVRKINIGAYVTDIQKIDNKIWVTTNGKGIQIFGPHFTYYNLSNGLLTNSVHCVIKDIQDNIWIGTDGEGLLRFDESPFLSLNNIAGLSQSDNFAILKDKNGTYWIGNGDDGLFIYDGKEVQNYNQNNSVLGNMIRAIKADRNGVIWIATNTGLVRYDGKFKKYTTADGLCYNDIKTLAIDGKDLWVGSNGGGLSLLRNGKFTNFSTKDGLLHKYVHALLVDGKGNLWIGSGMGMQKYNTSGFVTYNDKNGLCNSFVGNITEDNNGDIWVGTDRCLSKLVGDQFIAYNEKDGLNSNLVYLLKTDAVGNIWVGTNKGLDKLTLDEDGDINKIEYFGREEGFTGIECNSRAVFEDDSCLYFGSVEGVFYYYKRHKLKTKGIVPVFITGVNVFLKKTDLKNFGSLTRNNFNVPDTITLPYEQNHISFLFTGIDLSAPQNLTFSYKLNGFDKDWSPPSKQQQAVYSYLLPGHYTFKVIACRNGNCASSREAICHLIIQKPPPPFFKSWWFYFLLSCLFFYILYYFVIIKPRYLERQKLVLEQIVNKRTSEIRRQDEEKTVMLKEIHHRVKNNLQIINSLFNLQSRFTSNEESLALFLESQNRVRSMAKIHEKLYEAKDFSNIDLKGYVTELLDDIKSSYHLDKSITYKINVVNCKLHLDHLVPVALILNELISNALKYAFKEIERGTIVVDLYPDEKLQQINLFVADNGKGLSDLQEWREPQSMGFELIQILTDQLDGIMEVNIENGTAFHLKFNFKA